MRFSVGISYTESGMKSHVYSPTRGKLFPDVKLFNIKLKNIFMRWKQSSQFFLSGLEHIFGRSIRAGANPIGDGMRQSLMTEMKTKTSTNTYKLSIHRKASRVVTSFSMKNFSSPNILMENFYFHLDLKCSSLLGLVRGARHAWIEIQMIRSAFSFLNKYGFEMKLGKHWFSIALRAFTRAFFNKKLERHQSIVNLESPAWVYSYCSLHYFQLQFF